MKWTVSGWFSILPLSDSSAWGWAPALPSAVETVPSRESLRLVS